MAYGNQVLLRNYMKTCLKTAAKNDMKIRVIGDIEPLDEDIKSRIRELEEATANNGGLNFTIALNYGSRDEITRAARKQRLSNYLLWQLAYSEFYFTDVPWPAFTKEELIKAVEEYNRRHRRFGGVEEAE